MNFKWDRRTLVLGLIFAGYLLCYLDRMVISTAIPYIGKEFGLTKTAMGAIMSAFFAGYTIFQIPGGVLVDKFGPRKTMTASILIWTLFTGLTGAVTSFTQMIIARALFGLGEGPYPASSMKSIALWFEPSRRAFATSVILSSNALGPAIAPLFAVAAMAEWGWRGTFYSLIIPGVIIAALIALYVPDSPEKFKKSKEKVPEAAASGEKSGGPEYTFLQVLREPVVLRSTIMFFFFNIAGWGFKSWLPAYLVTARNMKMAEMGIAVSIAFTAGIVGYLFGGWLSDGIFRNRRRVPVVIFQFTTAVLFYLMYTVESMQMLLVYQTMAGFSLTAALATVWALPVSAVSKKITGRAVGIFNTGGQLAGLLSPIMIGYLVDLSGAGSKSFDTAFIFMIACIIVSSVMALSIKVSNFEEA
jgi:sugar phosphate permease